MNSSTKRIHDLRCVALERAREIQRLGDAEERELSAEERENFDAAMADVQVFKRRIDDALALEREDVAIEESRVRLETVASPTPPSFERVADAGASAPDTETRWRRPAYRSERATAEYQDAWLAYVRSGRSSLSGAQCRALDSATGSSGGFLVPTAVEAAIVDVVDANSVMRARATVIQSSTDRDIPIEATKGTAAWRAEEAAASEADQAFGRIQLTSNSASALVKASVELLSDSAVDVASYIGANIARRIAILEDAAFVNGDGSGKPTGIMDATSGGDTGVTAASATAITFEELLELYYSVAPAARSAGSWIMNSTTALLVSKIRSDSGAGAGTGDFVWNRAVAADQPDTLLGKPVLESDDAPAATSGLRSVGFGDISAYYICDRDGGAVSVSTLSEIYAVNGQVGFLAHHRTDGALTQGSSFKVLVQG